MQETIEKNRWQSSSAKYTYFIAEIFALHPRLKICGEKVVEFLKSSKCFASSNELLLACVNRQHRAHYAEFNP